MQQREDKKLAPVGEVVSAYWRHTLDYKGYFGVALLSILVIQTSAVIAPFFLRQLINVLTASQSAAAFHAAFVALVGFALAQLVFWAGWRFEMFAGMRICAQIMADLSNEGFAYLMRHSYQFFTSSFSGALTRRVGRYSDAYNRLWDSVMESVLPGLLYTFGIVGVLWFQNPLLGITIALADSISNHNTVQLFTGNRFENGLIHDAAERLRMAYVRTWSFDMWVYALQSFISLSINIALLWVGLLLWQQGLITIGDFVLIQSYFIGLINNVWNFGREFRNINSALADASEMVYILTLPHEVKDLAGAKPLVVSGGGVEFSRVDFNFSDREVLHDFNLSIKPSEKTALVGPSGAGKTTITKLLLRLFDVKSGAITIDGQNIARVTQDSLRDAIAFVPQEPVLFHRTLMENIRYGRRDATDEEVIEAATKAHCHEFISQLPLTYGTYVGERGIKLSGGERQRVAIARAILKNAPILVLDEATSSLDSESEALIQDALEVLMQHKTVIVIAHRLSTIMKMDRIVVLEGGAIVADGTHQELLEQGGLYQKLWSIQAGGFLVDEGAPAEPGVEKEVGTEEGGESEDEDGPERAAAG